MSRNHCKPNHFVTRNGSVVSHRGIPMLMPKIMYLGSCLLNGERVRKVRRSFLILIFYVLYETKSQHVGIIMAHKLTY